MSFNNSQIKAINHYLGPALVIAGPGSGKTFTITRRIKKLITERGVTPSDILVLTFTKAAALEMQERFIDLMPSVGKRVNIGTFHSVFFNIIKHAYNYNGNNIIKTEKKFEFISDIIKTYEIEVEDEREFIVNIINDISSVKGSGREFSEEKPYEPKAACTAKEFNKIFTAFEEKRINNKLLDFDDMLLMCNDLFKSRTDILKFWQEKFKFILIDEFQDINDVQFDNIKMLAEPENNIFVVGDDDQSIYKFRGARPEIMHQFEKEYKKSEKIILDINYRSTESIVEFSKKVIDANKNRFKKSLNSINGKGTPVNLSRFDELADQNTYIVESIKKYNELGTDYSDMAILFRTNLGAGKILESLSKANINFCFKDRVINIFEHWVARDVFSYIKIANGDRSRREFLKVINRPKRYISREALKESEIVDFKYLLEYYSDKEWMTERIEKMEFDIRILSTMKNPYAYVNYIRKGIGYEEFLNEYAKERNIRAEELTGVLDELAESAKQFSTLEEWYEHIEKYGKKLKMAASSKSVRGAVNIVTMHGSKGLEFDTVFIPDVNESIIPHVKAIFTEDIEEERRIFYVALTRAKNNLNVSYCSNKSGKKIRPSRFLEGLI